MRQHQKVLACGFFLLCLTMFSLQSLDSFVPDTEISYELFTMEKNDNQSNNHLSQTLKRHKNGKAAVAMIRVLFDNSTEDDQNQEVYLMQRKSLNYPIQKFSNALCLYGGNSEDIDENQPIQTLIRELREELPDKLVDQLVINGFSFLTFSYHDQNLHLLRNLNNTDTNDEKSEKDEYAYVCALYESYISWNDWKRLTTNSSQDVEGNHILLSKEQLLKEEPKYAWGYDYLVSDYFGQNVTQFCDGVTYTNLGDGGYNKDKAWISPYVYKLMDDE